MSVKQKKIVLAVLLIFAVNFLIIALAQSAKAESYKRGSSGDTVKEIQNRLKSWGYYEGGGTTYRFYDRRSYRNRRDSRSKARKNPYLR